MADNPYFQVEAGAGAARFDLTDGMTEAVIGRATDCQWVIRSGMVSRRHAIIRRAGHEVTIEDLGSSNGTFVNGERLGEPRALRDQDRVQLGAVDLRFVAPASEANLEATVAVTDVATVELPPRNEGTATASRREDRFAFPSISPSPAAEAPSAPFADTPTIVELALIAAASFLVVFAVGALFIRYVF
jgi:ABC transport system ATP-binding/permease protein